MSTVARPSATPSPLWKPCKNSNKYSQTSKIFIMQGELKRILDLEPKTIYVIGNTCYVCLCGDNFKNKDRKYLLVKFLHQKLTASQKSRNKYYLLIVTDPALPTRSQCPLCFGGLLERLVYSPRLDELMSRARFNLFRTGRLTIDSLREIEAASALDGQALKLIGQGTGSALRWPEWDFEKWGWEEPAVPEDRARDSDAGAPGGRARKLDELGPSGSGAPTERQWDFDEWSLSEWADD